MKSQLIYIADDDTRFDREFECLKHEALGKKVTEIMAKLPSLPSDGGCAFENGGGYIQHDPDTFLLARKQLLVLAKEVSSHKWIQQSIDNESAHPSYVARILDDYQTPIRKAWHRIYCTTNFREYGQPYFAINPEKAKDICLNSTANKEQGNA